MWRNPLGRGIVATATHRNVAVQSRISDVKAFAWFSSLMSMWFREDIPDGWQGAAYAKKPSGLQRADSRIDVFVQIGVESSHGFCQGRFAITFTSLCAGSSFRV